MTDYQRPDRVARLLHDFTDEMSTWMRTIGVQHLPAHQYDWLAGRLETLQRANDLLCDWLDFETGRSAEIARALAAMVANAQNGVKPDWLYGDQANPHGIERPVTQ